ncbi:hypothetical protein QAD02_022548 [Eretmocerus hayati]|uniref:Uncharacterized protein n=1 Tax=Eretmocerus hayati TaxID=131215 RepID=A0ACC2PT29_9HYME|nr:hypothetical protein QAD02_022548 [Eretmocerus hayati]
MNRNRKSNVAELNIEQVMENQFDTLKEELEPEECDLKSLVSKYARDDINTGIPWATSNSDQDIVKCLGGCLNIDDYETNLVSSWILKTIGYQIMIFPKQVDEKSYETAIKWLYEAITVLDNYPELSREDYFELLNKIFYESVSDEKNGTTIIFPSEFLRRQGTESGMELPLLYDDGVSSNKFVMNEELGETSHIHGQSSRRKTIEMENNRDENSREILLHLLVDAIYQIMGDEITFMLVKNAFASQREIEQNEPSFHFEKPRVAKKLEPMEESMVPYHSELESEPDGFMESALVKSVGV